MSCFRLAYQFRFTVNSYTIFINSELNAREIPKFTLITQAAAGIGQ